MYVTLLPFLGMYIVARLIDWVLTGGNHVDQKINQKVLYVVLVIVVGFGIVRNIPIYPFTLLVARRVLKNKTRETKFFRFCLNE